MITFVKQVAEAIGSTISYFWSAKATEMVQAVVSHIYTGYVRKHFAHWGKGSVIAYKAIRLRGLDRITIGKQVQMSRGLQLTAWPQAETKSNDPMISIGDYCTIREGAHISSANRISIGCHLLTGTNVLITDNSHGQTILEHMNLPFKERPLHSKGPVTIGNNVWLGNNVCVMPGVTIGDGVVVGANSVVTHDIPAYCVAAGIPAKVIKDTNKTRTT